MAGNPNRIAASGSACSKRARPQLNLSHDGIVDVTAQMKSMKAIVVTDQAAGTAGMKLVERPEPPAAINDVIVQISRARHWPNRRRVRRHGRCRAPDNSALMSREMPR